MAVSVTPPFGEKNLVVVTVAAGVRLTIDVDERFGVAEVAGDAQRQMKGDRAIRAPVGRHGEAAAEYEIESRSAPRHTPRNRDELIVDRLVDRRLDDRGLEGTKLKRLDRRPSGVHLLLDEAEACAHLVDGAAGLVIHRVTQFWNAMWRSGS